MHIICTIKKNTAWKNGQTALKKISVTLQIFFYLWTDCGCNFYRSTCDKLISEVVFYSCAWVMLVRMGWRVKYSSHLFVASLSVSLLFLLWFVFVAPSQCSIPPHQDAGLLRNTRGGQNRGADAGSLWTLHPSLIKKAEREQHVIEDACVCVCKLSGTCLCHTSK